MSFFFTSCKTVCDSQGKHLAELQAALGERMDNEVNIISLSKDPKHDTPEELKKWEEKYGVGKGWTLLTGDLDEISNALQTFSGKGPGIFEHDSIIMVGNADKKKWVRISGFTPVDEILQYIEKVK